MSTRISTSTTQSTSFSSSSSTSSSSSRSSNAITEFFAASSSLSSASSSSGNSSITTESETKNDVIKQELESSLFQMLDKNYLMPEDVENAKKQILRLKSMGSTLDAENIDGCALLHMAIEHWRATEIAIFLIENGANLNAKDIFGHTPLHRAIILGRTEIIILLIRSLLIPCNE